MRTDEIHPGDLIAGKYRVRAILGRSHGMLLEGFHTEFDQRVVIKILLSGYGDEREIERFRREARTLAKLESEHVARIIDVGTEPDGSFYLVRQFLEGMDLASYVAQHGPLPLVDAALTILMVAEAVAETHSHGIIVRELQPAHLFLTQRAGGAPLVKITDFGTAKLMRDAAAPGAGADLTATAMFGLSPYSSPELLRKAKNVDVRTDVWSLGAIFYELLTGHPPFTGESARLMLQITREDPLPATHLRPELPAEVESILGWALAKDLDARFKNVQAFAESLRPWAPPEGQVLIERIAQITERAKLRKRGGSVPPPSFPSARPAGAAPAPLPVPSAPPLPAPSVPPPSPSGHGSAVGAAQSTHAVGGASGSVPPPGLMTAAMASPPAPPPLPASVAPSHPPAPVPPPPPVRPTEESVTDVRPLPGPPAAVPSFTPGPATGAHSVPPPAPPIVEAPTALPPPVQPAAPSPSRSRMLAFGALAVAAVVLPIVVLVVVLRHGSEGSGAEEASAVASAAGSSGGAAVAASVAAGSAPASAGVPSGAPTVASASATAAVPVTVTPTSPPSEPRTSAPPPPPPPPPPAAANGTLLAVAMGGSCAFSVNGASKGTSTSIKVSLKPGAYTVMCRPASGAPKSKSVTVKSGETAMAAFKL
jgi:serine/threonine protein kinase